MTTKCSILTIAVCCTACISSLEAISKEALNTPQKRAAYANMMRAKAIAKLGGQLVAPPKSRTLVVENTQLRVPKEFIDSIVNRISTISTIGLVCKNNCDNTNDLIGVLSIVDKPDAPSLTIYPEKLSGELNVNWLLSDNPSDKLLKNRVQKQMWRLFAIALGAGNSSYQPCLLRTIRTLNDLDAVPSLMPSPEVLDKVQRTADLCGIGRYRVVTYKKACIEGWAPAPTNDIQRAIWEQVRTDKERGPTNPIKIPPPKKR